MKVVAGTKIPRLNGRAGSIPAPGTIFYFQANGHGLLDHGVCVYRWGNCWDKQWLASILELIIPTNYSWLNDRYRCKADVRHLNKSVR